MQITGFNPANRLAKAAVSEYLSKTPCDHITRRTILTEARVMGLALISKHPTLITIEDRPGYSVTRVSYI